MLKRASFVSMVEKLDRMHGKLIKIISDMEDISSRGLKIVRSKRRPVAANDGDLEEDFKTLVARVKRFALKFKDFWSTAVTLQRKLKEAEVAQDSLMVLKNFVTHAREINLTIEEFESVFDYMRKNIKNYYPRLGWWGLEVSVSDIMRFSGKILFVSREISRVAEK
jgi:hypothetical protein